MAHALTFCRVVQPADIDSVYALHGESELSLEKKDDRRQKGREGALNPCITITRWAASASGLGRPKEGRGGLSTITEHS